jgi:hypothetical protein
MKNITIKYDDFAFRDYLKDQFESQLREDNNYYHDIIQEYLGKEEINEEDYKSIIADFDKFYFDYLSKKEPEFIREEYNFWTEYVIEDITNQLVSFTDKLPHKETVFYIEARNIGWRHQSGYAIKEIETGEDLIKVLTGNYDFTLKVTFNFDDKLIEARVFHHDAPTGGEFYTFYPIVEWIKENDIMSIFDHYSPENIKEILWYNFETGFDGETREELKKEFLEEIPAIATTDFPFKSFMERLENYTIPSGVSA